MLVVSCSHGKHLGKLIAVKSGARHSGLLAEKFPDNELRVRLGADARDKDIFLVQSFYGNISDCILEVILAASTARDLGAKKISLVAPYFPYMRQDKRFRKGEAVSQQIVAGMIGKYFDSVFVIDPHLHRTKKLGQIFKIRSEKLTANDLMADYIRKNIKNPVIIGPDGESYKWAKSVADMLNVESRILEKKRHSSFHVEVKLNKRIDLTSRNAVIVDDIVSTGHTIMETAKTLRKLGAKKIYCVCVHGIFVNNTLTKLKKSKIGITATNTIPNRVSGIDVSGLIADSLN